MPAKRGFFFLITGHEGGIAGWNFRAWAQREVGADGYLTPGFMLLHITIFSGCSASDNSSSCP